MIHSEHGVAMLSSVLQSDRAVQVNIAIMRTFARLRQILATHKELAERLAIMEKKYDQRFKVVFEVDPIVWTEFDVSLDGEAG